MTSIDLPELSGQLFEAYARLSLNLLGAVASAHRQGVPLALAAGVNADTFLEKDHRVLWLALETAADHGLDREGAAKLARTGLRAAGCWNPLAQLSVNDSVWCDEDVVKLYTTFPGPAAVGSIARELVDLTIRWQRVRRLAGLFEKALTHAAAILHPRQVTRNPSAAKGRAA